MSDTLDLIDLCEQRMAHKAKYTVDRLRSLRSRKNKPLGYQIQTRVKSVIQNGLVPRVIRRSDVADSDWWQELFKRCCKTYNRATPVQYISSIKTVISYADRHGWIAPTRINMPIFPSYVGVRWTPDIEEVGAMFAKLDTIHSQIRGGVKWNEDRIAPKISRLRCKLACVIQYFCGLRWHDVSLLCWNNFHRNRLIFTATKTEHEHVIPLHPIVLYHLQNLAQHRGFDLKGWMKTKVPEFGYTKDLHMRLGNWKTAKLRYREACEQAGVPRITPHAMRRASLTQWSSVDGFSAALIHGCGAGGLPQVIRRYASQDQVLRKYMPMLSYPKEMLPPGMQDDFAIQREEWKGFYELMNEDQKGKARAFFKSMLGIGGAQ